MSSFYRATSAEFVLGIFVDLELSNTHEISGLAALNADIRAPRRRMQYIVNPVQVAYVWTWNMTVCSSIA